jgi:alkanesulfonate monooxygenase SsuD/methylene tetrahydromethanopterin reductase-like flavin-dependent oxidoreductase (luciferase family)
MVKGRSGETMKLGAFFHPTGNHVAAWLHPDAQIDAGTNFRPYAEITQTAERGKFDLMFVADARRQARGAQPLAAIHGLFRSADAAAGARRGNHAYRSLRHCDDQL